MDAELKRISNTLVKLDHYFTVRKTGDLTDSETTPEVRLFVGDTDTGQTADVTRIAEGTYLASKTFTDVSEDDDAAIRISNITLDGVLRSRDWRNCFISEPELDVDDIAQAVNEGQGLHQATIAAKNASGVPIQGAKIFVVGTTRVDVTGSNGQVKFNLNAAAYTFRVASPSGYVDPADQTITISADTAIDFVLTPSPPSTTTPSETSGSDQNKITAAQTVVDGCPVLPKLKCHEVKMGQDARLLWHMVNDQGEQVNLEDVIGSCESASSKTEETFDRASTPSCGVELRIRELMGTDSQDEVHVVDVEILDAGSGYVRSDPLPDKVVREPGIYIEEWAFFTEDYRMLFSNQCCTFVQRGLFGLNNNLSKRNLGPPTLQEIRLSMRDNAPEDNVLLDDLEFDAAEIAQAVSRPIQFWNETPPPLRPVQSTKTFPFREMWMVGIQAYLMEVAAHHYRRNDLEYSAGGVSVADKRKEQVYMQTAAHLKKQFQDMCRLKKVEINTSLFAGSIGSSYGGMFY